LGRDADTSETGFLYHVTPLHYLPMILQDRALYAQSVTALKGILPRASAFRRDRMLGLNDYVHLSLTPHTPLLADKLKKGYPHALLIFSSAEVMDLPEVALLKYNPKSWQSRIAFQPVFEPSERIALWRRHHELKQYRSLEVLVKYGLSIDLLKTIVFLTEDEREMMAETLERTALPCSYHLQVNPDLFPRSGGYYATTGADVASYLVKCQQAGYVLAPPAIPFD
jgi:hypothetical protein